MEIKGLKVNIKGKKEISNKFKEILDTGMVAAGKNVREVEEKIIDIINCLDAVGVSSGSDALLLIYKYIHTKLNKKKIGIPTNTFYATYRMAEIAGLKPELLPCKNLFLDLEKAKITIQKKKLDVVTLVHAGGFIDPDLPDFAKWCRKNDVILIEDCAHSLGSKLKDKHCGNFGFAGAISFFATKTITGGEGGIVVTNDKKLSDWSKIYRNYGKKQSWVTYHESEGENLRMNEFSAAVISVQLDYLDQIIKERSEIAELYMRAIPEKYRISISKELTNCSWYKFPIFINLAEKLKASGINLSGGIYDVPLHLQPIIKKNISDKTTKHYCLPIYQGMTVNEKKYIKKTITKIFKELKNERNNGN